MGYRGIDATLSKMREAGHKWATMRSDVTSFISALTSQLGSKLNLIPVGSSEENGICERKFRDVRADLGALVRENPNVPWSKLIKIVERVINSSVNSLTKLAPADLRLGKRQALDTNILFAAAPMVQSEGMLSKPALAKEH